MKVLAVSEHYFPRVGGTVNYVHETLCALTALGVDAELLVPGPESKGWLPAGTASPPYRVRWLDAGYPAKGDPTREQRYRFCYAVDAEVRGRLDDAERPDVMHVLFGLFVMEVLDTELLRRAGLASVATVHNVPPMECRQTAHTATLFTRLKEVLRLQLVSAKNRARLRSHAYDSYIVPSNQVAGLLRPIVGESIDVIGHGPTSDLQGLMSPPTNRIPRGKVNLLTAAGYAPHKRQHIIPETATCLANHGVDFRWDVVGPSGRVPGYFDAIENDIRLRGLQDKVTLRHAVPLIDLAELYDRANIYVQPSIEEGFCLTALDAAVAGIPVIGCAAGALPDITVASGGTLVPSEPEPLAKAIAAFISGRAWRDPSASLAELNGRFSWSAAAACLVENYARVSVSGSSLENVKENA